MQRQGTSCFYGLSPIYNTLQQAMPLISWPFPGRFVMLGLWQNSTTLRRGRNIGACNVLRMDTPCNVRCRHRDYREGNRLQNIQRRLRYPPISIKTYQSSRRTATGWLCRLSSARWMLRWLFFALPSTWWFSLFGLASCISFLVKGFTIF